MSRATFLGALNSANRPVGPTQQVLTVLDEFCAAIEAFTGGDVKAWKSPGFVTNLGQEYRIMLKSVAKNVEHLLLRAHVPPTGLPVKLDLYDENLINCVDEAALQTQLTQFLQRTNTLDVIETLRRS